MPIALLKTSVMMIGEFDFGDIFLVGGCGEPRSSQVYLPAVSYMVFVAFLIVVAILIVNLLVSIH